MAGLEDEGNVVALRAELEEERWASSSGANEALAMILRLQAEKAAERMGAEQFRRVAEERIQHDGDTLAFLKAVVFHQEMEISSHNRMLLAVHAGDSDPFSLAAVDLAWLRKLAKKGVKSKRNASLRAASLKELCSELEVTVDTDKSYACKEKRPARTVSDIGEVIGKEKDWTRPSQPLPPPRLHRSASYRLRSPSYSALSGIRSPRALPPPEMIIVEESEKAYKVNSASLEADFEQIKAAVQSLQTDLTKLRESTVSIGDAQSQLLTETHSKLTGAMLKQQTVQGGGHGSSPAQVKAIREEGSSSSKVPHGELPMNHFIEVCGLTLSALLVRPLLKVAASMSLVRGFLILALAVAIRKVLMNT